MAGEIWHITESEKRSLMSMSIENFQRG